MEYKTLVKAGIKKHKAILAGIFALVFLVAVSLGTVLTVWTNSDRYLRAELNRAGFGGLTAWVSGITDTGRLTAEVEALSAVDRVETQRLVFSNYTINKQESDSEGQLILYAREDNRYRFFTDDLSGYQTIAPTIRQGEVYVSPSLISMFDIEIGDEINFAVTRNSGAVTLIVKGYYEDPFMGSSMIGMKGFLINQINYNGIVEAIQSAGVDALARDGAMLHIFQAQNSQIETAELNSQINENTTLAQYTEFVHSADAIAGFMLILQKAFSGLMIAFVLVLLLAVMVVLGHNITGMIEADTINMGILKTMGATTKMLRRVKLIQYIVFILLAMAGGLALSKPLSSIVTSATLTTSGVLIPTAAPWGLWIGAFLTILLMLSGLIVIKTASIGKITPMKVIRGETVRALSNPQKHPEIDGNNLGLSLAIRQLLTNKKSYLSTCVIAALLTLFISTIGSMDTWLGADGKGMMDAFNPADHDIGVQVFGSSTDEDTQKVILEFTDITDTYLLAMPSVALNGIDYTVNAISEPNRFHILSGKTCQAADEIVVTEFVAADLGVAIGDTLSVTGDSGSGEYTISGIYSCANDMGNNIGMSREGYLRIGKDEPQIWCHHYFLADEAQRAEITKTLDLQFGGDVHVHENTWPGLLGIIFAMRSLVAFMYVMVFLFILIVTAMASSKILSQEQHDIGIYKALGFDAGQLRRSFALRFGIAALIGSIIGVLLAAALSDALVSTVMKLAGISNFAASLNLLSVLFPVAVVMLLFMGFAYLAAGKIKKTNLSLLITE